MLNLNFKIMKKVFLLLSAIAMSLGVSAQVATVSFDNVLLSKNGSYNYQSKEYVLKLDNPIAVDDVVSVSLQGEISEAVEGLQIFLIECAESNSWGWTELSDYVQVSEALAKGDNVDLKNVEIKATTASEGSEIRVYISTTNKPVEGISTISIATGAAPEPPYTDAILGTMMSIWGDGNKVEGKTLTFGTANTGIGFANYEGGWDLSAYGTVTITLTEQPEWAEYVQVNVIPNDDADFTEFNAAVEEGSVTVDLTQCTGNVKQLYLQAGGTGEMTISEIKFTEKSSQGGEGGEGGEPTAVESVSADSFAVVGGMVYSAGEITVYNVAGKAIATASQSFNVNSLEAGVYFISAQEGTIKFVK